MKEFTGKYTESGKVGGFLISNYFKAVKELISKISDIKGITVQEFGCGAGYSTEKLLNMLPKDVKFFASDIEEENVKDAKERLAKKAQVFIEDIYNIKKEESSLDLIFVLEVMEHLEDPQRALKELHRVAKSHVILGVPNEPIWRVLNMARLKYLRDFGNTPGHIQHWNKRSFKRILEENSFEVIEMKSPLPWILFLVKKVS